MFQINNIKLKIFTKYNKKCKIMVTVSFRLENKQYRVMCY